MPADPNRFARDLFAPLPARYDLLAEILSFGQNGRWRSTMVDHILPVRGAGGNGDEADGGSAGGGRGGGAVILDVASGTAGVALQLAARGAATGGEARGGEGSAADGEGSAADGEGSAADGEGSAADGERVVRVVGVDLTEEMLRQGRRRVAAAGRGDQVRLVAGRAEQLPFPDGYFDALTFTYLLRYVRDPQATLGELARVLKPGGTMASLEFCVPTGAVWHPAWWAYTRLALPAGGWLLGGREWFRVGRFLGPNISGHYRRYPVSWTVEAWRKAGFTDVGARVMSLGGGLVMWGKRAGA
jgi:demethylmenaquinone methyltransferase / 2-methoxy-6-polyprenyl-1,4-benzoquinol methylase